MNRIWTMTAAMTILAGASLPSAAQDVEVRVKVSPEIAADLRQAIDSIGPQIERAITQNIDATMRELGPHLAAMAAVAGADAAAWMQNRAYPFEQTKRETRTLALGANGSLELQNLGGDVTVTAGGGRDVTIEIIRTSRGRTDADAQTGLQRVTVEVDQRGSRATVRTSAAEQDRRGPYQVSAAYNVTAPAGTSVAVRSLGGSLHIKGIRGDVSLNTAGGNIDVTGGGRLSEIKTLGGNISIADVDSDAPVSVETFGGTITLQNVRAPRLAASTTGGNVIARDIASGGADLGSLGGNVEFSGTLAKNGRYDLHTTGGDVRIAVSGGTGFELDASTFAGSIQSDLPLQIVGTAVQGRGPKRTMHATFGDGSAVIKATTLSGNVVIGKK